MPSSSTTTTSSTPRLPSSSPAPTMDTFSLAEPWTTSAADGDEDTEMEMEMERDMDLARRAAVSAASTVIPPGMSAHPYPQQWAAPPMWYGHQPPQHSAYSHIHQHPLTLAPSALTFTPPPPQQPTTIAPTLTAKTPKPTVAKKAAKRAPSPTPSDDGDSMDPETPQQPQTKKARGARISSSEFIPPDVSGLSKREARLVKNRAAAFLSRQRKREEFECMEVRVAALEKENARLLALASSSAPTPSSVLANAASPTPSTSTGDSEMQTLREQLAASAARERELMAEMERLRVGGASAPMTPALSATGITDLGEDSLEEQSLVKIEEEVEGVDVPSMSVVPVNASAAGRSHAHGHHGHHDKDKDKGVPGLGFMVLLFSLSLLTSTSNSTAMINARRTAQGLPTHFAFSPVPPAASASSGATSFVMDSMLKRFSDKEEEERRKAAAAKGKGSVDLTANPEQDDMDFEFGSSPSQQLPAEFEIDFDIPDASNIALLGHSASSPAPSESSSSSGSSNASSTTTQKIRVRIQPASTSTPPPAPSASVAASPMSGQLAWDGSLLPSLPFSDELPQLPLSAASPSSATPAASGGATLEDFDFGAFVNQFGNDGMMSGATQVGNGFEFDFACPPPSTAAADQSVASTSSASGGEPVPELDLSAFTNFDFDDDVSSSTDAVASTSGGAVARGGLGMFNMPGSFHTGPSSSVISPEASAAAAASKIDMGFGNDWLVPPAASPSSRRRAAAGASAGERPRKRLRIAAKEGGEWEVEVLE